MAGARPANDDEKVRPGQRVGPYELLELLGEGGSSTVYRARDVRSSRKVALKLAPSADPERFQLELAVLVGLGEPGHPGVVRVLDHDPEPTPRWYAMEELEGGELTPESSVRPSGNAGEQVFLRGVLTLVDRLATALDYIHCHRVVHADLSVRNVRLRASGEPVICDLGAAHRVPELGDCVDPAAWAQSSGTPGYAAPERLLGQPWDSRADLYSLGCLWYELLTRRPVFIADHEHGLVHQHVHSPPTAPTQWVPDFAPDLERLLLSLLSKNPHERPPRASMVAEIVRAQIARIDSAPWQGVRFLFTPRQVIDRDVETLRLNYADVGRWINESLGVPAELDLMDHVYSVARGNARDTRQYLRWCAQTGRIEISLLRARLTEDATAAAGTGSEARTDTQADESGLGGMVETCLRGTEADVRTAIAALAVAGLTSAPSRRPLEAAIALVEEQLPGQATALAEAALRQLVTLGFVAERGGTYVFVSELQQTALMFAGTPEVTRKLRSARVQQLVAENKLPQAREVALHRRALGDHARAAQAFRRAARAPDLTVDERIELMASSASALRRTVDQSAATGSLYVRTALELLRLFSVAGRHEHVWALSDSLLSNGIIASALQRARVHRARGLSYRMVGDYDSADSHYGLATAELALLSRRGLAAQREHIDLQIQRARLHYVKGEAAQMARILRELLSAYRHVARSEQRADLYMNLANAIVSRRRYAYSRRAVHYQRKAHEWHAARPGPVRESALSAQFDLAFMLLLGEPLQCTEALLLLDAAASLAKQFGETPLSCRIELYRAIALRRLGRVEASRIAAEHTLERAKAYGFRGYQGAALACLAWAEHRAARPSKVIERANDAARLWWNADGLERDRYAEYPFQWLAHLPLLAVYWNQERYEECGALLDELRHPAQARFGRPLRDALRTAHHARNGDESDYARALQSVIRLARASGYL